MAQGGALRRTLKGWGSKRILFSGKGFRWITSTYVSDRSVPLGPTHNAGVVGSSPTPAMLASRAIVQGLAVPVESPLLSTRQAPSQSSFFE